MPHRGALASGEGGLRSGPGPFRSQVLMPTRSRGAALTSHLLTKALPPGGPSGEGAIRAGAVLPSGSVQPQQTGAGARLQSPLPLLLPAQHTLEEALTPHSEHPAFLLPPFLSVSSAWVTCLHRGELASPSQKPAHLPIKSPSVANTSRNVFWGNRGYS